MEVGFILALKNSNMKKKLCNILLVDDSKADNFISNRIINKAEVTEKITTTFGAREALDFLCKPENGEFPKPEIIFLDINMPGMSGWDFLDEYILLNEAQKAGIIVCMLTTSDDSKDRTKATEYEVINHFSSKPLTKEKLMSIIEQHFPDYL